MYNSFIGAGHRLVGLPLGKNDVKLFNYGLKFYKRSKALKKKISRAPKKQKDGKGAVAILKEHYGDAYKGAIK